jgi:hypothetical protein
MTRPDLSDAPALVVGLAAASWVGLPADGGGRIIAVVAATAVLVGVLWRQAATIAGCLLVTAVAVDAPGRFTPVGVALTAALLTLYLVLVDAGPVRLAGFLVPAATAVVAITALAAATGLPAPAWAAPVGMASAAAAVIVVVHVLRGRRRTDPLSVRDDER